MRSEEIMKKAEEFEKDVNEIISKIDITNISKEEGMVIGTINQGITFLKKMAGYYDNLEKRVERLEKKND